MKTLVILMVLAVFDFHSSTAQADELAPSLTLDAAIQEGLDRSPDVQKARDAKSQSHWHHFEVLGEGFLPKVTGSAIHYFGEQYTITNFNLGGSYLSFPGFYPTNSAALDVSIPVFNGLANVRNLQAASLLNDASEAELSRAEFQLRQDIRLAFYHSLSSKILEEVADQNVRTLEDHLKQIEVQKGGGVATNYDVLRVQVQLNEARADKIDADDAFATSRKKLTQLLGLEDDSRTLEGVLPVPDAEKLKGVQLGDITEERKDIKALALRAEGAEKSKQAAGAWFVPSVSLVGNYTLYDQQTLNGNVQDTGNYLGAYNVGISLKWNIFDGGVALAKEREAAYSASQLERTTQSAKLQVPYDFDYWKRRYLSNTDHYLSKQFDVKRSEESVRLARAEQSAGTRTTTETLDAELDLFRSKEGVVNAQMNAAEAQIRLELILGKGI